MLRLLSHLGWMLIIDIYIMWCTGIITSNRADNFQIFRWYSSVLQVWTSRSVATSLGFGLPHLQLQLYQIGPLKTTLTFQFSRFLWVIHFKHNFSSQQKIGLYGVQNYSWRYQSVLSKYTWLSGRKLIFICSNVSEHKFECCY